jgi:hypothetical protein
VGVTYVQNQMCRMAESCVVQCSATFVIKRYTVVLRRLVVSFLLIEGDETFTELAFYFPTQRIEKRKSVP